jgi:hypothetical protein
MTLYFRDPDVAQLALDHRDDTVAAFETISLDEDFAAAAQSTTKSLTATFIRLKSWSDALRGVLNGQIETLRLENGRIVPGV